MKFSRKFLNSGVILTLLAVVLSFLFYFIATWERSFRTETIVFNTNVVADTSNSVPVDVKAKLYLPRKAQFPISIVVIAPSSSGVEEAREIYYAKELVKKGIAALVVDSFSSRNLTVSLYDQSLLESWQVENDVLAALKLLKGDSRFKSERIAIMGVSKGGTVAMDTALEVRRNWTGVNDIAFAAHIAISPDCKWTTRTSLTTGAPIMFMLAEHDDQTPIEPCINKASRMQKDGNEKVVTKVYKGAHHAWEELGSRPVYDPEIENYSSCRVWIEDDGQMFEAETGELVPEENWHSWAQTNCVTLGAHCCGGTRKLKENATRDIIAFLKKYNF